MAHSFSPFLAHLLMAGLARRALLSTDIRADRPGADEPAVPPQAVMAAEGTSSPAQSAPLGPARRSRSRAAQ
jgi:hypothetical protein